ncbi:hypothetical protein QRD02_11240 [Aequorivita sp. SDUM287046]|uniref:DUF4221 domain-containing protein n=1 Tax=Aequorivita aurantiaca TaxID=3053356 RepID=A0ABT8DM39_9FLAO|nr:hypothetical protein [Aequorivita aurantiaca]MDN3724960.1 hypothetical protein [Aequorivita aurantiaca]
MKITVSKIIKIDNIPSGSGIVKYGENYLVIGDDSPFLFSLDKNFKLVSKTPLLDSVNFSEKRIVKANKPDFEAMERVGENELVIFGSGSKAPERNVFVRILLKDSITVEKYDVSRLYQNLKNTPIFKNSELNIEATAFFNNHIYLFNRKKNLIIKFEYPSLIKYIKGEIEFPEPEIKQFSLPKINGIEAGFSGATALQREPKIIFTASVENTDNAYDDGEILGSFIGMVDIANNTISEEYKYCEIPYTEARLKVESVTVKEEITTGNTKVVLITDDDKGNSIILESTLHW